MRPPGTFAILLAGILATVTLPGCENGASDEAACETGDDPMPSFTVLPAACGSTCPSWLNFDVAGDATVLSLETAAQGEYTFTLYWPGDATTVDFSVTLPGGLKLPFDQGDVVDAHTSIVSPWWTNISVVIKDREAQRVLLGLYDGSMSVDLKPPACEREHYACGTRGYPTRTWRHPDYAEDPNATTVDLRQGEWATATYNGVTYSIFLKTSYVWVTQKCSDVPPGWSNSLTIRRLDLDG